MNNHLYEAARKLRLSGLISSLEIRLQEAMSHGLSHAEFLELLVQDELLVRSDRTVQRRLKVAAFREQKTLEDFDWAFNASVKKKQVYDLYPEAAGGPRALLTGDFRRRRVDTGEHP